MPQFTNLIVECQAPTDRSLIRFADFPVQRRTYGTFADIADEIDVPGPRMYRKTQLLRKTECFQRIHVPLLLFLTKTGRKVIFTRRQKIGRYNAGNFNETRLVP